MPSKNVHSARSSDLESASRASARLVAAREQSRTAPARGVAVPPPAQWASLAARIESRGPRAPGDPPPPLPPPEIDLADIDAAGDRGWNAWLAWACEAAPAEAAFVVDRHGLAIASRGELPDEDREAVSTRLVVALEQAARLDPDEDGGERPSLSIDWRGRTWSATWCADVVLCVVSVEAVPRARLAHVAAAIARAAEGLSS